MIVPLSLGAAKKMDCLRDLLALNGLTLISSFEIRPAKLFDGGKKGADQRLNIFITMNTNDNVVMSTQVLRWKSEHRKYLFSNLHFSNTITKERFLRFSSQLEFGILSKMSQHTMLGKEISPNSSHKVYFRSAGLRYWIIFVRSGFGTESESNNNINFNMYEKADYYMSALNSNLYWWYYATNYDMFNQTMSNIFGFRLTYIKDEELENYGKKLDEDLEVNKEPLVTNKKDDTSNESYAYNKKLSKPIIDDIDKVLAKHYGFTDEELDFIINYDIKYRMGDELNEGE